MDDDMTVSRLAGRQRSAYGLVHFALGPTPSFSTCCALFEEAERKPCARRIELNEQW
jgi:hypothetical protein